MTTKENKIKQSETRTIWRSEIKLAEYNPRKISDEAKKLLKANLKRLGIMGGVVWNEQTGNLVAGHQKVSICDEINRYGEGKNDYQLKVEVVSLTEIEEKEQNLFMNNRAAQGEFDEDMLRSLISDIDLSLAGFNDFDVSLLSTDVDFEFKDNGVIWQNDNEDVKDIGKDKGEGVKRDGNFIVTGKHWR